MLGNCCLTICTWKISSDRYVRGNRLPLNLLSVKLITFFLQNLKSVNIIRWLYSVMLLLILATNWLERLNLACFSLTNLCLIMNCHKGFSWPVKGLLCFIKSVQYNIPCVWLWFLCLNPNRVSYCWRWDHSTSCKKDISSTERGHQSHHLCLALFRGLWLTVCKPVNSFSLPSSHCVTRLRVSRTKVFDLILCCTLLCCGQKRI